MAWIDFIIIAVYLASMVLIGLWMQKKASSGIDSYFLGNRSMPWWMLGISGMASNLDVSGTMINTALLFALGISGFLVEIRGGMTLVLAFVMIFMGKWNCRSGVMTLAEWMQLRFGKKRDGDVARIICAIASLITTIAFITYFCIGAGKFIAEFLGIPAFWGCSGEFWVALLMIILSMIYTVSSGLYGVIVTDLIQSVLIFATIIIVCFLTVTKYTLPEKFTLSAPVIQEKLDTYNANHPDKPISNGDIIEDSKYTFKIIDNKPYVTWEETREEWTGAVPKTQKDFPEFSQYSMFNMFGLLLFFYLVKVALEGYGGLQGYMLQRYFAARSDKDAGLLSLFWTFLLSFRWPFITALAMMGIYLGAQQGGIGDPEKVLPLVVNNLIPIGLKGLLVAGLMAAAMSTFDSTVNAGAAYWVKDLYQTYINPKASEKTLIWHSRISSIIIVLISLVFTLTVKNINDIWGWITMGIGAGMLIPLLIRWYWWRLNGWGFALGMAFGLIASIIQRYFLGDVPEYISFSIASGASLLGTIVGTYLTAPTDEEVLKNFYIKTRPFGFWGHIRNSLSEDIQKSIAQENRRDIFSTFIAVPWQVVLFMAWIMLMMQNWNTFAILLVALVVLSVILYFSWFRHLSKEVKIK